MLSALDSDRIRDALKQTLDEKLRLAMVHEFNRPVAYQPPKTSSWSSVPFRGHTDNLDDDDPDWDDPDLFYHPGNPADYGDS